jgi:two-component system, cell cycle response regulator
MRVLIAHSSNAARATLADAIPPDDREPLELVTCAEGNEALDVLLGEDAPDVAVIDWDLPGIEGPEMCRLVRDFHHGSTTHLIVLASSAHPDTADAWRAGAAQCISTPAPAAVIRDGMQQGLRATRERREREEHDERDHDEREHDKRPMLEAVCTRESDDRSVAFFSSDGAEPCTASAPSGASLLQAVLAER